MKQRSVLMLQRVLIAGLGLAAAVTIAVAAPPPRSDTPPGQSPAVVQLRLNQDVDVENGGTRLKLGMTDIKDSRCPSDVQCIRAGEATIFVLVTPLAPGQSDKAMTVSLSLPGEPQPAFNAVLSLQQLDPYPMASQPNRGPYVATVRVSAGKGN